MYKRQPVEFEGNAVSNLRSRRRSAAVGRGSFDAVERLPLDSKSFGRSHDRICPVETIGNVCANVRAERDNRSLNVVAPFPDCRDPIGRVCDEFHVCNRIQI